MMSKNLFNKQIHENDFKLRLSLTDGCNYNCSFCLNDFQKKPDGDLQFLDIDSARNAIIAYSLLKKDYPLQVHFSGGEPTLHKGLVGLIAFAKDKGCRVTLNTNGSFDNEMEKALALVDCMNFGVYKKDDELAKRIKRMNGKVQCVYSLGNPYVDFDFLKYYLDYGLEIKIFGDLHEDPMAYAEFAEASVAEFPNASLSFRSIGIQENRGIGCNNCDRYCVISKGAWVFPNSQVSHCPQKCKGDVYSPKNINDWMVALKKIGEQNRAILVDIDFTEQMAFSWPDPEIEGWRNYRIEYGGCNEDCYYEGSIWLPPEANIDYKLFEILQVPEARQELHESIERIHNEKVGKLSNWRIDNDTGKS